MIECQRVGAINFTLFYLATLDIITTTRYNTPIQSTKRKNYEKVITVFRCDMWHTFDSFALIGVATCTNSAIKIIKDAIKFENIGIPKSEHCKLSEDDERILIEFNQTQNMQNFEGEFIIEENTLNTLNP